LNRTTLSVLVFMAILCLCFACAPASSSTPAANSNSPATIPSNTTKKTTPAASPTPAAGLPVIDTFYISPAIINPGDLSYLYWEVSNATSISISPSVGSVNPLGNQQVAPESSTEYKITASNAKGAVTAIATVMMVKKYMYMLPVVLSFNITPRIVSENDTCIISWNIFGADSISLEYGSGTANTVLPSRLSSSGKMNVKPPYALTSSQLRDLTKTPIIVSNTNYTVKAKNVGGTTTATTEVTAMRQAIIPKPEIPIAFDNMTVLAADVLPIITWFNAEPYTIIQGNSTVLTWEASQATKVLLNGAQVPVQGRQVVRPGGTSIYTLSASNEYWTSTKTVTVSVLGYNQDWFKPVVR
jgi:hypothetical protein